MKTFEFEVKELLARIIEVEAETENDAYLKVKEMYKNEGIVLDSSDTIDYKIKKVLTNNEDDIKENLITEVIRYLYQDEKRHYEEFDDEKPSDHIYLKLKRLKELI